MHEAMSQTLSGCGDAEERGVRDTARYLARQFVFGYRAHDKGMREKAERAFTTVDAHQFQHLDEEEAELAACAFVDALWEKDRIEMQSLKQGDMDKDVILSSDWSPVTRELRKRASIIGADQRYAVERTKAWKHHKSGKDYWTPYLKAQTHELRAAMQDPTYPNKPKDGAAGFGPEPARMLTVIELHDMHTETAYEEGIRTLVPYFQRILESHDDEPE